MIVKIRNIIIFYSLYFDDGFSSPKASKMLCTSLPNLRVHSNNNIAWNNEIKARNTPLQKKKKLKQIVKLSIRQLGGVVKLGGAIEELNVYVYVYMYV